MKYTWITASIIICAIFASTSSFPNETSSLTKLKHAIRSGDYGNIHSVLAADPEPARVEWYFSGNDQRAGIPIGTVEFNSTTLHDVRSLTKSVVSILFGIALSEGAIGDIDQ